MDGRWITHFAICFAVAGLVSCAHDNIAPATKPEPPRIDPIVCAQIPDEPSPAGAVVRPLTPEEITAYDRFVDAEISVRVWGREGWRVVRVAQKDLCR